MAINEKQKYPTNKQQYDKNYLMIFGKRCPKCRGYKDFCNTCGGIGWVKKEK